MGLREVTRGAVSGNLWQGARAAVYDINTGAAVPPALDHQRLAARCIAALKRCVTSVGRDGGDPVHGECGCVPLMDGHRAQLICGTGGEGGRAQVWTTSKVVVSSAVELPPAQTSKTEVSRTQSRSDALQ